MEVTTAERIKYMTHMGRKYPRTRDGELETHFLRIQFTRDEAATVSAAIASLKETDQHPFQLIQNFCLTLADQTIDAEKLVEVMAQVRTRSRLAEELSQDDYHMAMTMLDLHKKGLVLKAQRREENEAKRLLNAAKPKEQPKPEPIPQPAAPPKKRILREFVPDTRRR